MTVLRCSVVLGLVAMMVGCDGPGRGVGAEETEDSGLWDGDGDGYAAAEQGGLDCDDGDPAVSPEGVEVSYDGLDNDCDPATRDDDLDGDGYPSAEDCNDALVAVSPGAEDLVGDGYDQNCDGVDGADADGDGVASEGSLGTDCDDADDTVYPGALERCDDGVVNDCDAVDDSAAYAECGWSGEIRLGESATKVTGASAGEHFGSGISAAGDLDGDGKDDVVVSAYTHSTNVSQVGAVYVLSGEPGAGPVGSDATVWLGETAGSQAGSSISTAGDLDGDGYDDLAVGASGSELASGFTGAAYLVFGPVGPGGDLGDAEVKLGFAAAGSAQGMTLTTLGDLNGDDVADLVVAAPNASDSTGTVGAVYLFTGAANSGDLGEGAVATVLGLDAGDDFARAVASGGDLNGDGFGDLVVGDPAADGTDTNAGAAYIFYGPLSGTMTASDADSTFAGAKGDDRLGTSLSMGGDSSGDGLDDLLVGAPNAGLKNAGRAYLVAGESTEVVGAVGALATFEGTARYGYAGSTVEMAGDFDGDGLVDPVVGAISQSAGETNSTAAYVLMSPLSGSALAVAADAELEPEQDSEDELTPLSAGDVNGDGLSDLLLGAPFYSDSTTSAGAAYLLYGYSY